MKAGGQFGAPPQVVSYATYFWPMISLELSTSEERGLLGWGVHCWRV